MDILSKGVVYAGRVFRKVWGSHLISNSGIKIESPLLALHEGQKWIKEMIKEESPSGLICAALDRPSDFEDKGKRKWVPWSDLRPGIKK